MTAGYTLSEMMARQLLELVCRDMSGTSLRASSKFSQFTTLNSLPAGTFTGLFLDGSQSPLSRLKPVGYWTENRRPLWICKYQDVSQGAKPSDTLASALKFEGATLIEAGTGTYYKVVTRRVHWITSVDGTAGDSMKVLPSTLLDVVKYPSSRSSNGTFDSSTPYNQLVSDIKTNYSTIFAGESGTVLFDNLLSTSGGVVQLSRDGALNVGVSAPAMRYPAASGVNAGGGADGRTALVGTPHIRAVAETTFSIHLVRSVQAGNTSAGTETAVIASLVKNARLLARWIAARQREYTRAAGSFQFTQISVAEAALPQRLEDSVDAWYTSVSVSIKKVQAV